MEPKKPEVTKKDLIYGLIIGVIIIVLIVVFIFLLFEENFDPEFRNVINWILPFILMAGGVFLIFTNIKDKENKRKGLMVGGIIVVALSVLAVIFKVIGWL